MAKQSNFTTFFNTPEIQALANATQLGTGAAHFVTLSNTQLLLEIQRLFMEQNKTKLDTQYDAIVRSILQNEILIVNQEIIKEQLAEIITLLKGGDSNS